MNYKAKIFMDGKGIDKADTKFNSWMKNNQNVCILQFEYQQAKYGEHSICILYREESPNLEGGRGPVWQPGDED